MTGSIESGGCHHQNCGINQEREEQCHGHVHCSKEDRLSFSLRCWIKIAGLRNRGMQIEIVRHDGGSENTDRYVKHFAIVQQFAVGDASLKECDKIRFGQKNLNSKAGGNQSYQRDDKHFQKAKSLSLKEKDGKNIR